MQPGRIDFDWRWIVTVWATLLCMAANHACGSLTATSEPGWTIFEPFPSQNYTYRYGPSIIMNSDGSTDMWFCSNPFTTGGWDSIRYRRTLDYGQTWEIETVALQPTPGSNDRYSACDPGAIKIGEYYYIGYTSTHNADGSHNEVYVARSTSPSGGFQKWDGASWGGNPEPAIRFDGPEGQPGAGEPSFVVKDDTLYVYYTWNSVEGPGYTLHQTRVSTAPANDPNWPALLEYRGVAMNRSISPDEDSVDVKYVDAYDKFIGVSVGSRFSPDSYIHFWQSDDGLSFTPFDQVQQYTQDWAHNVGISGTADGHYDINANNFVAYAYSEDDTLSWGFWHTYLNPITISFVPEPGDVNGDGTVDTEDVLPFLDVLTNGPFNAAADMNQDMFVNGKDVGLFVSTLRGGAVHSVPEPAALSLLLGAMLTLSLLREHPCSRKASLPSS